MIPFDSIDTIEELITLLENANYEGRYRVELEIERDYLYPTGGIVTDHVHGYWQYGKNGTFRSSKKATEVLSRMVFRFEEMITRASIVIWNGYDGSSVAGFQNDSVFLGDFNSYMKRNRDLPVAVPPVKKKKEPPKILCNKCFQPVEVVVYDIGVFVEPCECVINDIEERLTQAYEEGYDDGEADFKCED